MESQTWIQKIPLLGWSPEAALYLQRILRKVGPRDGVAPGKKSPLKPWKIVSFNGIVEVLEINLMRYNC